MARQRPASVKDIAARVVKLKKKDKPVEKPRTGQKDVKTPMRKDVTLRAEELTPGGRLTLASFTKLAADFPGQNLKRNFVGKQLKWYREQKERGIPLAHMPWSRKRKNCGRGCYKFTPATARKLIEINNKHWGALSYKRLAGKLKEAGIDVVPETVRTWSKELGMTRRRRYIKRKLTIRHKIDRLSFVLDQIDPTTSNFNNLENVVHGDEKWFFMMKDGTVCRVFPDKRGEYKVPAPPRVFHKSRMPKVMFLAVCARPRPEYNFDGKIGLWSFTLERPAKRSDVRTGTVVGQTMILEDVSVTAPEYRMKIVGKDGVFDSMRRSMWWFHKSARYEVSGGVRVPCGKHVQGKWQFSKRKGTRCPEAGQPLHYQHDGARPHTAQVNQRVFASHGKMKDFNIQVVVQPAQSPDLNVDDLAFFHSLQSDVSLVAKENRHELLEAVEDCWKEYPEEKMSSVWVCLYSSFHGVLESGGKNDYPRHRGFRSADNARMQEISRRVVRNAQNQLEELRGQLDQPDEESSGDSSDDTSSEESD